MKNRPDYKIVLQADHIKRLEEENGKLKQALKNISKGKIDSCCCAEEYASKILKEVYYGRMEFTI